MLCIDWFFYLLEVKVAMCLITFKFIEEGNRCYVRAFKRYE